MLIVERQQRILDLLRQRRSANLDQLSRELDVSSSTVRRDLEVLEKQGMVERTHGGVLYRGEGEPANPLDKPPSEALATRMREAVDQKRAIGRYAASLVEANMTVLLDGGSTVILAAQQIEARPIQVVTTSLSIAQLFKDDDQIELIFVGGTLYPRNEVTVGPITTGTLADLHADLLLCSLAGIYEDAGFNINLTMARAEQVMMRQATQSILLMDGSKFGRKSLARVAGLTEFDQIVTDPGIDPAWVQRLGDRLIVAPLISAP